MPHPFPNACTSRNITHTSNAAVDCNIDYLFTSSTMMDNENRFYNNNNMGWPVVLSKCDSNGSVCNSSQVQNAPGEPNTEVKATDWLETLLHVATLWGSHAKIMALWKCKIDTRSGVCVCHPLAGEQLFRGKQAVANLAKHVSSTQTVDGEKEKEEEWRFNVAHTWLRDLLSWCRWHAMR